jgi:hypothetical protein
MILEHEVDLIAHDGDPRFAPIMQRPRFRELVKKIGLPSLRVVKKTALLISQQGRFLPVCASQQLVAYKHSAKTVDDYAVIYLFSAGTCLNKIAD